MRWQSTSGAEYLRIEIELDALTTQAKQAMGDLLRNGVFIDGGFSSSRKGDTSSPAYLQEAVHPVFPTTYNSRDTWPMSGTHFREFVHSPAQYVKRIMGETASPLTSNNFGWTA